MAKFVEINSTIGYYLLNTDAILFIADHDYLDEHYVIMLKDDCSIEINEKEYKKLKSKIM